MKKNLLIASTIILASGLIILNGCKKDDTTAPVITLTGSASSTVSLPLTAGGNGTWTDPGFTASDDVDGDISSSISASGAVNLNRKGTYTISYSVTDKAGNYGSATRTITVVNDAESWAGTYANSTDSCVSSGSGTISPSPVVSTSDSVNFLVRITNFGGLDPTGAAKVYVTLTNSVVSMSTPQNMTGTVAITNFYSFNSGIVSTSAPIEFKISYQWNDGTNNDICVSHYKK